MKKLDDLKNAKMSSSYLLKKRRDKKIGEGEKMSDANREKMVSKFRNRETKSSSPITTLIVGAS